MKRASLFTHPHYLTDGGLETTLVFHRGIQLNHFAAFELLTHDEGMAELGKYYLPYLKLASKYNLPFVVESPTWRANSDWGFKLGYTHDELFALNKESIKLIRRLAGPFEGLLPQIVYSGNIGPRGDGYKVENAMNTEEAKLYHLDQVKAFALADADVVTAATLNYSNEAIGIINAARSFGLPVVISFTVETNGALPNGESLQHAIERTDRETGNYPEHYMVNCAHPRHFLDVLKKNESWKMRIGGVRANASLKSHAELDQSDTLDEGDKRLLSEGYKKLFQSLPKLQVIGGCCGTNHDHLEKICKATEHHFHRDENLTRKH